MKQENEGKETTLDKSEKGRRSYKKGHSFEERVAELYRLLHYDVTHGREFSSRQVDLFLTRRLGDLTLFRAIECKDQPVRANDIDAFIAKLALVRKEYPSVQGTIVSAVSFSDPVTSHAAQVGIQLTLYPDLAAQLLDGHAYARRLIGDLESSDSYPMKLYVEPSIADTVAGEGVPAFEAIDEWLESSDCTQLTLLGDVGTGKSFLSRMIAHRLGTAFLEQPLKNPLPILIDLRNADRQFSLEGLILTHLAENGMESVSFKAFQYCLSQGNLVLILDGFDEMSARVTPQVTNRNFHELARCANGRAKALLTCRTHYFKSRTEEEEVILGGGRDLSSDSARELYWELVNRKGFGIAYLRPFELSHIEEYVRRAKPKGAKQAMRKIRNTYNLIELSHRPLLLDMIVKSIERLKAGQITPAMLYKVSTDVWVHRDKWRDVVSPDEKLSFLMALAYSLWQEDAVKVHHTSLLQYVQRELATRIQNPTHLIEIDSEIRTASFLTRDESGNYGFAHRSYGEFFLAKHLSLMLNKGDLNCLNIRRLSPEIIGFLRYLVDQDEIEPLLEKTLRQEYRRSVSENALLCLYGFRRDRILTGKVSSNRFRSLSSLVVPLPPAMKLNGAQMDRVTLEGASLVSADLTEADLSQAILTRADLQKSKLIYTNLESADLTHVSLRSAQFFATNLIGANLEGADLSEANITETDFSDAYLLGTTAENTVFVSVKTVRAMLSEELKAKLQPSPPDSLTSVLDEGTELNEIFQPEIQRLVHKASAMASLTVGLRADVDANDIAQEVLIVLLQPEALKRLHLAPDKRVFVRNLAQKVATQLGARSGTSIGVLEDLARHELFDGERPSVDFGTPAQRVRSDLDYISNPLLNLIDFEDAKVEEVLLSELEERLSPASWNIMRLRFVEGYTVQEIAEDVQMSRSSVHRLLTRSLQFARKLAAGLAQLQEPESNG